MKKLLFPIFVFSLFFLISCENESNEKKLFSTETERIWIGPDVWANPLQDWKLDNGKLVCLYSGKNRNVNFLTYRIENPAKGFEISFECGFMNTKAISDKNFIGIRLGAIGPFNDYRSDAIYGKGLNIGLTTTGKLFAGTDTLQIENFQKNFSSKFDFEIILKENLKELVVTLEDEDKDEDLGEMHFIIDGLEKLEGSIALVSSFADVKGERLTRSVWFEDVEIEGDAIAYYPERAYGPVLFVQYTLSKGTLKLLAQMPPVGEKDGKSADLQIKDGDQWKTINMATIDTLSRTALFKIEDWKAGEDTPYRLAYKYFTSDNELRDSYFEGIIRKEPTDKDEVVMAAFTGNSDLGFPNNDLVRNVTYHNPDLLFFSGDQIYEHIGGYGVLRLRKGNIGRPVLDYLRKWYMFGWVYRDLMRDRPSISIPDDHDVFQSNLWGAGGIEAIHDTDYTSQQTCGGYTMPPEWINMVQRTQTGNLPDPFDTTPIAQNISVYYTSLDYGGISFAILEDRKFKSGPQLLLPEAQIWNGWPQNPEFDVISKSDVSEAVLLGDRQLDFLEEWAADWSGEVQIKAVLSQTIFANVATLPSDAMSDAVVPKLRILPKGEYPPNDKPVTDFDSNGWPMTGRNKAVDKLRKAYAVHIAGDQHLGSAIQYGENYWHDGGYAFCVPSVSNIWPRRWYPSEEGKNYKQGMPKYAGDYRDGFGNLISVYAVSNPYFTGEKPARLYDRAVGYGIIRFNKKTRDIIFECWPRQVDVSRKDAMQYDGWPITINQFDNNNQSAEFYLPSIQVTGMDNPVIRVSDKKGVILYTVRIKGNEFQPKVYNKGSFTISIGEPETEKWKTFENNFSKKGMNGGVIKVDL